MLNEQQDDEREKLWQKDKDDRLAPAMRIAKHITSFQLIFYIPLVGML